MLYELCTSTRSPFRPQWMMGICLNMLDGWLLDCDLWSVAHNWNGLQNSGDMLTLIEHCIRIIKRMLAPHDAHPNILQARWNGDG